MPELISLVRVPELSDVAEYAYAAAVQMPARLVFAAGACPLDSDGATVAPGDVAGQARQAMGNLRTALAAAGAGLADVVRTTVYVASTSQADLVAAWDVVRDRFGDHDPPSTLLGVTVLGYTGQLVEIDAIAAVRAAPPGTTPETTSAAGVPPGTAPETTSAAGVPPGTAP